MKSLAVAVSITALVLVACSENSKPARCVTDADCAAGEHCIGGECSDYDPCAGVGCDPGEECVFGSCVPTSCTQTSCDDPPGDRSCFDLPAPCENAVCHYESREGRACDDANACTVADSCRSGGVCAGTPLACDNPDSPVCKDDQTLIVHASPGNCLNGVCQYPTVDVSCPGGCLNDQCQGDPCQGVTCDLAPEAECISDNMARAFSAPGSCSNGVCSYPFDDAYCPNGCQGGTCSGDPCAGVACDHPPADFCTDGQTLRQYEQVGQCQAGECLYGYQEVTCDNGCVDGRCLGCTPEWIDVSLCDCTPSECSSCTGTKHQQDGCGNERDTSCSLPAAGCAGLCCLDACCASGQVCSSGACCAPDCAAKECGGDGCGGSCGACQAGQQCTNGLCRGCVGCKSGETCIDDHCAPIAILLARPSLIAANLVCPQGYTEAGHWLTGPGNFNSDAEGIDFHKYKVSAGWMWLCSADTTTVKVVAGVDDCGANTSTCAGQLRGAWHVGAGCTGSDHGVDAAGIAIRAGWLRLCVSSGVGAKVESGTNDCGADGPGCGLLQWEGSWHTDPAQCGSGNTGVGDSGTSIETGWMTLCTDSASYPPVDASTLDGKVVAGYQGWFGAPGDGSQRNAWVHWFRSQTPQPADATFDLWPDLGEYTAAELFASNMQYPGGATAKLYSAYNVKTVERHMKWMAQYGIDAAFLQRFLCESTGGAGREFRDQVTRNVISGAEKYGRAFVIMYDISGANGATLVDDLIADWKHLVDDPSLQVTASDRYLKHDGRPLVAIWGFGFTDRPGSAADAQVVIDFFHNAPEARYRATVMGGVPTNWRTGVGDSQPGFGNVYRSFDVISPWSVGRYNSISGVITFNQNYIQPDLAEANNIGKDYLPVVWPGFSWANLKQDPGVFNSIPRNGGTFFTKQFYEAMQSGCGMLYVAMFDEVDESTAIYKAAPTQSDLPTSGQFLALDQDGYSLPSDWYLRLAGAGMKMLTGQIPPTDELPLQ
ncbi:MAG TPA: glycoside hydrolase family 71/99-like protein [Myxococcota bacterium]|nr:glycoside hydrolase family 71/99-like protein [Myxococcota bacterium]